MRMLNSTTPNIHFWFTMFGNSSCMKYDPNYSKFCVKFPNFRYHGNNGRSYLNSMTLNSTNLKTTKQVVFSLVVFRFVLFKIFGHRAYVNQITDGFVSIFPNCRYHGNKDRFFCNSNECWEFFQGSCRDCPSQHVCQIKSSNLSPSGAVGI